MNGQLCLKSLNDICSMFSPAKYSETVSNNCPFAHNTNTNSKFDNLEGFYIPSFQRGYRWTALQVEQLVQDLVDFCKARGEKARGWYCLQPLVVVPDKCHLVVIDGQQRLTTLYLILKFLGMKPYALEYETRKRSKSFLEDINIMDESKSDDEIQSNPDFYCIYEAWKTIRTQLQSHTDLDLKRFTNTILDHAKVIWYETSGNSYDEFIKLNSGKLALSNAELIKALLLKETLRDGKKELSQLEAAREWDYMEQMLHDDDFWCFINPSPTDKRFDATRLDFVFEMVLRMDGAKNKYLAKYVEKREQRLRRNEPHDKDCPKLQLLVELDKNPYFIFGVFQSYCETPDRAITIWKDVQGVFRRIYSWYSDRNLFHRVGYLMNRKGMDSERKLENLAKWLHLAETSTKATLLRTLDEQINVKEFLESMDHYEYAKNNNNINDILLLFNIAIMMRQRKENSRYPFREHKSAAWSLEHIHAKDERPLTESDFDEIASWLSIDLSQAHCPQEKVKALNTAFRSFSEQGNRGQGKLGVGSLQIVEENTDGPEKEWHFSDGKNLHAIGNLALLGHRANSEFNNALFAEKRAILVQWQKRELSEEKKREQLVNSGFDKVEFVPTATIMVFFKQFSEDITLPFLWTEKDAENYVSAIRETLQNEFSLKNDRNSSNQGAQQ